MKKFTLSLLFSTVLVMVTWLFSNAQVTTDVQALEDFSILKAAESSTLKARALEFAIQNGLPVSYTNDEGTYFELQFVDEWGNPHYYRTDNVNAAATISTDRVFPGGGAGLYLDGTGITPRLWDAGAARPSHQEFGGRVVMGDGSTSNHYHSTHVAGTIMASGVVSSAKGMAPNANLRAFDWNSDASEMASEAANGALMSNHSYGYARGWTWTGSNWAWYGNTSISTQEDYLFGFYDSQAHDWDQIALNAPYFLICKSAGNDRNEGPSGGAYPQDGPYDCISHSGIAKNVLTVGAVNDIPGGYSGPGSVSMSSFSSWGPADDGRIKPDIVSNGISLYSTDADSDSDYTSLSGTSMATPSVAGSLALLQEHWENLYGSGNYMRAATLKALVINTADEAGPWDGPDYEFGWGLMNTEKAALKISEDMNLNVIDELVLNNGAVYNRTVHSDGTAPLKVTICWTDPPGTPVSAQLDPANIMLVNDLDLSLTSGSTTYYPWKMNAASPTTPATNTSENNTDNVEVVYIASPPAGDYTISVDHDGNLSGGSQAFSIVIEGITGTTNPTAPVAGFTANTTSPLTGETVQFSDLSSNNPDTWTWSFSPSSVTFVNGTTASSQNPQVTFDVAGTYDVTLSVSNAYGGDSEIKAGFITATDPAPFGLPWTEDFEATGPTKTFLNSTGTINGLDFWSYEKTNNGRLRLQAGSGFFYQGSHAATLDADPAGTVSVNYLIATLDLSDYSASDALQLSFFYMHHGEESHSNDRVWIRGSSTSAWIQVYDLYSNRGSAGAWNSVSMIDIDAALSANGQSPTSTFQLRFGQEDNYPATSTTSSDGITIDNVSVIEVDPSQYIISSFPYLESWEEGLGLWFQSTGDDFDWTLYSGGTPSSSTGPLGAHDGTYYLYTESSSPRVNGDEAHLEATFDFSELTAPELSFFYHMFGGGMGSLHVDVYDGITWNNDIWVASDQQQNSQSDPFLQALVDLSAWEGMNDIMVRFRAILGNGIGSTWQSDMAIDLIEVYGTAPPDPPLCSNPQAPANGASGVVVSTGLSWDAVADATGYTIFFGTDDPPTNIENGTDLGNVTAYNPGILSYSTDYFWKIVPYNSAGAATGCQVWNFTTEDPPPPPSCTTPLNPLDGEGNVLISSALSWNAVGDADGYYLYFGTDNPPTNLANGTDLGNITSYDPAGMSFSTGYFWKVVPYNSWGSSSGCTIWSFSTENQPPPPICTTPVNPADGETDVLVNSTLTWDAAASADGYYLYFGTDNPPANLENGTDLGNVTSYDPAGMSFSTGYFCQVVPYNSWGTATGCPVWSFTTENQPPPPTCTTPVSPAVGAANVPVGASLSWNAVADADGYYLYFGTDNPPANLENGTDLGNVTSYDPAGMGFSTGYFWKVVPYNVWGTATGCPVWSFTTEDPPPPPTCTTPVSPAVGAIDVPVTANLTWNTIADADGYILYFGSDYPPQNIENGLDLGNVTTYNPSGNLRPATAYFWKIVPYNAYGYASGCDTWSFTTLDVPVCASNPDPVNGATNILLTANLSWSEVTGATGYYLYFGTNDPPSNIENGVDLGNTTTYDPSNISYLTTYYWKVVPYNDGGPASGCSVWNFTTEEDLQPSIYPYAESFETGFGIWTQSSSDELDWTRHSGRTSSSRTGPNGAYDGTYYIYLESSYGSNGDEAHLEASFDISGLASPELSFLYHMFGNKMGSLHVDIFDGTWHNSVWSISGQQHSWYTSPYTNVTINLSPYNSTNDITIRIRGVRGNGYRSDMAVDLIEIYDNVGGNSFVGVPDKGRSSAGIRIWSHNDRVHVELPDTDFNRGEIIIMNVAGQPVLHKQLEKRLHNEFLLSVQPGCYVVKVVTDGNLTVEKILLF